jgi:hypothetical protein
VDRLVTLSWLILAAGPCRTAAVLLAPAMTERLYEVPADGVVGLLIVHRGALFLAVLAVALAGGV